MTYLIWYRWTKVVDIVGKSAHNLRNETFEVEPEQMQLFPAGSKMVWPYSQWMWYEAWYREYCCPINLSSTANSQELKHFLCFGMDAFVDFRLQPDSGNANKCHGSSVQKQAGGRKSYQVKRINMDEIRRTIPRPCRKGTAEISGVIPPGHQQATMRVHGCIGLSLVSSYNAVS